MHTITNAKHDSNPCDKMTLFLSVAFDSYLLSRVCSVVKINLK